MKDNSRRIPCLVVDDDRIFLKIHQHLATKCFGGEVTGFLNAREAITFLNEPGNQRRPFLILLDLNMPEMDGWEFLEYLRISKSDTEIRVAIVTSSTSAQDRLRAKKYPFVVDFIIKPMKEKSLQKLSDRLHAQFNGRSRSA
ncbi:response regulator [Robertkochia aurantiaca]|uniref:response regulator n=1 Tax=Robertkochia aurantiaca TaxID=2873700 RepID=UPI001CCC9CD4|nr:response regulator [Robertkochia sp. 3YJGBD-33]